MYKKDNAIWNKSFDFAVRIVKLGQYLQENRHEYVLSKQVVKSGTSIGANIRESIRGQSTPDFYAKLSIALKEAEETCYWLELLRATAYISESEFVSIYNDCEELLKLLVSITKTIKTSLKTKISNS